MSECHGVIGPGMGFFIVHRLICMTYFYILDVYSIVPQLNMQAAKTINKDQVP